MNQQTNVLPFSYFYPKSVLVHKKVGELSFYK